MRTLTKRIARAGAAGAVALTASVAMTGQAQAIAQTDFIPLYINYDLVAQSYYNASTNAGSVWDMQRDGYGVFMQLQAKSGTSWTTRMTVYNNNGDGSKVGFVYYGSSGDIRIRVCRNQATDVCTGWKYGTA
jgi:hypothetical protein